MPLLLPNRKRQFLLWISSVVTSVLLWSITSNAGSFFYFPGVQAYSTSPLVGKYSNVRRQRQSVVSTSLQVSSAPQENGPSDEQEPPESGGGQVDSIRRGLRRLAQLSLDDYEWRMSLFKEKEADRRMEESLARMLGEDASYFRPMDASENKIGPLGRAEKSAVEWLSKVIDEEGRRAKKIVNGDGELVRPIDLGGDLGPLGKLEQALVEFLDKIRMSERQRVEKGVWRPKDMEEPLRGPLGQLELSVVSALQKIQEAEVLRMEQSRRRGGEVVRPIDVPGPLGDFELAVADLINSEKLRAKERQKKDTIVRPMDASVKGKLGEFEMLAVEAVRQLTDEERERLRNIQRKLQESRPMSSNKDSPLGILESIGVGIFRAPALLRGVFTRVAELLNTGDLDESDKEVLRQCTASSSKNENDNKKG